jgi:hypothetical protein
MTIPAPAIRLATAVTVLLSTCVGPGAAATVRGTSGADRLVGTPLADRIDGRAGNDVIQARAGPDVIDAGPGADLVTTHYDGAADRLRCGLGFDVVTADRTDSVADDCEIVSVRIARDSLPVVAFDDAQHETQVEPDSLAVGPTIVTAFQSGRFDSGGAAAIGWGTSVDAGRRWRAGVLPRLSVVTSPPGRYERVSDPVVAYDGVRGTWLIGTLGLTGTEVALLVSRSRDGVRWDAPVVAAAAPPDSFDKEWLVCDNGPRSGFRGRCYLAYLDTVSRLISIRRSDDGGLTWSQALAPPAVGALGNIVNGAFPVVRPDGTLVVLFTVLNAFGTFGADELVSMVSRDGGMSFEAPVLLARVPAGEFYGVRAPLLVSADVDAAGTVFVAWADCRFRPECIGSDIVLARSADGSTWQAPRRVPRGPPVDDVDHFVPGLAVRPGTASTTAQVAVVYHSFPRQAGCELERCPGIDIWLAVSPDGGRTWRPRRRLSTESMPLGWIANTGTGRMVGDYVSASWVGGRPVAVFSLATEPENGFFRQAIFATTRVG